MFSWKNAFFRLKTAIPLLAAGFLALLPAAAGATVIDAGDNPGAWSSFSDASAVITSSATPGALGYSYDLAGGNFVGVKRDVAGRAFDADGIRFHYRASGAADVLEFKFTDADSSTAPYASDKLDYKLNPFTADDAWHEVTAPFSSFATFPDGNGTFNIGAVTRFAVAVTTAGGAPSQGIVLIDNVRLYRTTVPPVAVDGFETGATNTLGQAANFAAFNSGATGSRVFVTTQARTGATALEINFNTPAADSFVLVDENLGTLTRSPGTTRIEFWAKGKVGGEPLKVEIAATGASNATRDVSAYGALTTAYQKYSIPLSDFINANFHTLINVKFEFNTAGAAGTVYIDDVRIVGPPQSDEVSLDDYVLDLPDIPYVQAVGPDAASTSLSFGLTKDPTRPGALPDNRAARIAYGFNGAANPYVLVERELAPNMLAEPELRFLLKGAGGSNNLEVKLVDPDDTVYIRRLPLITDTGGSWRLIGIPLNEFSLFVSGTSSSLDIAHLKRIELAVVRNGASSAATGTVAFDQLEIAAAAPFSRSDVGSVLGAISTPNNPFSPNGDGKKDEGRFDYTLKQSASVTLKIFNVRGVPVKTLRADAQAAGDQSLSWDGKDEDGRLVENGVYIFYIKLEGVGGDKDSVRGVIGVIR